MIGDREELPIQGMQVHARVDGFRARVLIDFYFLNDRDRQYEGTFSLRLPEGASPYFLAFGQMGLEVAANQQVRPPLEKAEAVRRQGFAPEQIMQVRAQGWEKPKEARMVPKEKAAYAYAETVRRRVDPALMEWSGAGVFSSRIFPITPHKLHRVVVGYDVDLVPAGADLELQLPVPEGVPASAVDLDIATLEGAVVQVHSAKPGEAIKGAEPTREGARSFYRLENLPGQVVTARLNKVRPLALAGQDPSGAYFATAQTLELPVVRARPAAASPAVFLVDTSMSANPDGMNVWLKLLGAILEQNRGSIQKFAVLFFNVETFWWKEGFAENSPQNVEELLKFANTLGLEGATDLGAALRQAAEPFWLPQRDSGPLDLFLLSDGAITWGEGDAYALSNLLGKATGGRTLFAYQTGMAGSDTGMLATLARESGGGVFAVVGEAEIAKAATAHAARPWELRKVDLTGGLGRPWGSPQGAEDIVLAGRPRFIFPGQRLVIAGRGTPKPGAAISLALRLGGEEKTVTLPLGQVVASELAPRLYGQIAVAQLEDFLEATEPHAGAFARHFRITGKSTSLLMLETEEDYLRFDIKPQNDVQTVRDKLAIHLVAAALDQLAQLLGDPKAAFLSMVAKLKTIPGVSFALSPALEKVLAELPTSVFQVATPFLACKSHTLQGVGEALSKQLVQHKPEYDTVLADALRRKAAIGPADALKALSSMVEANPGDGVLARDVGFTAMEWGLGPHAYHLFKRVAAARPYEPQTYRALAQNLAAQQSYGLALLYFEIALSGQWNSRFGEFRKILLVDYLRFLRQTPPAQIPEVARAFAAARTQEVARELEIAQADLLVTITWNTDNTDVDLHVIEPSGEECFYSHTETRSGGRITQDVTQGYGPEMYLLKKAPRGKYLIRAKFFASDANRASARTKVYATVFKGWGTKQEKVTSKVLTLEYGKEMHDIATVEIP